MFLDVLSVITSRHSLLAEAKHSMRKQESEMGQGKSHGQVLPPQCFAAFPVFAAGAVNASAAVRSTS